MRINGLLSPSNFCRVVVLGLILVSVGCNSTNGWIANRSGMRQYQRGHFAQARHRFARAISHDPCNPDYRHNLAMAIQKQGDLDTSEKILRYNLTINAMHQPSYHSLAQLLVGEGRAGEAQDLIAGWVETQPYVAESNIEMAWLQREQGDYAGAQQSLQNALRAEPAHPTALAHMGQLYQVTGNPQQAAIYYQRSLAANWDQPEVQSRLSTLTDPSTMSRSAMMRNGPTTPMLADNSMIMDQPIIASSTSYNFNVTPVSNSQMIASSDIMVPFASDPHYAALEDVSANPPPKARSRHPRKDSNTIMTAYPLPNFDAPQSAWAPTGTYGTPTMVGLQPPNMTYDSGDLPQMADNTYAPNPSGSPYTPQADPAHFTPPEMTASLPVVDPH